MGLILSVAYDVDLQPWGKAILPISHDLKSPDRVLSSDQHFSHNNSSSTWYRDAGDAGLWYEVE